ncbi:hypothetical protein FLAPJACK_188 [Bacillus phage Flapjack]|uniref:Uncharacterized protein n=1 Tax=Bacillus phage Flapjack TaxID=1983465 RepID=A0A1X9SG55_9CAUD|nr:hypothetical protein FLAPJACK_188 [Bacillus phage Flapjack]
MKLKHGDKYKHKSTGKVYNLNEDYNGLWYLSRSLVGGLAKTLSSTEQEMVDIIDKWYEKHKEGNDKVFMKELPITKKANKKYKKIITREQYSITAAISHEELGWFVDRIKALETELVKIKKEMA